MKMRSNLFFLLFLSLFFFESSCGNADKNAEVPKTDSAFLITALNVGVVKRGMKIETALKLFPKELVIKKKGTGEFQEDTYDDYEVYNADKTLLFTMTPKSNNNLNALVHRILIHDHRFKSDKGIGLDAKFSDIAMAYTISNYEPEMETIGFRVAALNALFRIKNTESLKSLFDETKNEIDASKIPLDANLESMVIWWE